MTQTLIVGYGNADRQDDGAAWHVLNGIAEKLGIPLADAPEDGYFPEGRAVDLWFVLQLVPEMAEEFARYQRICFVDAHMDTIPEEIRFIPLDDQPTNPSALSHNLDPAACIALTRMIYHSEPEAALLSVRGYHFQFARELSPETAALVRQAVDLLWNWITQEEQP